MTYGLKLLFHMWLEILTVCAGLVAFLIDNTVVSVFVVTSPFIAIDIALNLTIEYAFILILSIGLLSGFLSTISEYADDSYRDSNGTIRFRKQGLTWSFNKDNCQVFMCVFCVVTLPSFLIMYLS